MNIDAIAVDIDGTFVRSDYSYDVERFKRIWKKMKEVGLTVDIIMKYTELTKEEIENL